MEKTIEMEYEDCAVCPICGRVEEVKHMIEFDGQYYCRPCMGDSE